VALTDEVEINSVKFCQARVSTYIIFGLPDMQEDIDDIKLLTRAEVAKIAAIQPYLSHWLIVFWQLTVSVFLGLLTLVFVQSWAVAWSTVWGGLCVALPSAVFARGMGRSVRHASTGAAFAGFFFWETIKVGFTIALLVMSPKIVSGLSWLALLAGFVVVIKVYWLAGYFLVKAGKPIRTNNGL
jgi:ATP synthase protein I